MRLGARGWELRLTIDKREDQTVALGRRVEKVARELAHDAGWHDPLVVELLEIAEESGAFGSEGYGSDHAR